MSAPLSRALVLLALVPAAACDLYVRDEAPGDEVDSGALPDAQVSIDASDVDAAVPIDAPPMPLPNPGFVTPTSTTRANVLRQGGWQDAGPADWSCLAQPPNEPVPAMGYTLTGTVRDFANNGGVGGAAIRATALGQALASGTSNNTAGSRGTYRLDLPALPANASRVRFAVSNNGARNTITVDRYLGAQGVATLDLPLVSEQTATALPAFIGVQSEPSTGLVLGELRDCQGRAVSGAIVALSTSPTFVAHWSGGVTFYFSAGANSSLPVRHNVSTQTARDGRFMVINPTPMNGAEGTIQAWGFQTDADRAAGALKQLGKSAAVIAPSTVSWIQTGRARG